MRDVIFMAWRYMQFYWGKTAVLVASISLIVFLPAGLQRAGRDRARRC